MTAGVQNPNPAIFLHHESELREGGGGVQLCTREYFAALSKAGFDLTPVALSTSRQLKDRLGRMLWPDPYRHRYHDRALLHALSEARPPDPRYVFLNQRSLGVLLSTLRSVYPRAKFVVLSHGLESTDYLHELRQIGGGPPPHVSLRRTLLLGTRLINEGRQAVDIDHVFCLSPFELALEQWLGARSVSFLPRTVTRNPLDWRAVAGRLGYVGTLDHRPNREALDLVLKEIARRQSRDLHVRLIGGPRAAGEQIAREYAFVNYLGQLDDHGLQEEASTWSCFLHPLFCYARGTSTKLAIALGWEIPIVTTPVGTRGYVWNEGRLPMADNARQFAELAELTSSEPERSKARLETQKIGLSSPDLDDVAAQIRSDLKMSEQRPVSALVESL